MWGAGHGVRGTREVGQHFELNGGDRGNLHPKGLQSRACTTRKSTTDVDSITMTTVCVTGHVEKSACLFEDLRTFFVVEDGTDDKKEMTCLSEFLR